MAELPQFIALKSVKNQKYLVYKDQSTTELPNILECSGDDVQSQYARFKVEKDENLPNLVHIKSTYNDKYWSTASQGSSWIVAGANQKQPNKGLWSCTLFKPEVLQQPLPYVNGIYQFRHEQMGNLIEPKAGNDFVNALAADKANPTDNTSFIVEKLPG
ncbi:hypothetical protein L3X38_029978 [Prunus dulcis]|uniref:Agglutinin domain-containing protein n=1 Tax=Prunus dulcis TaxID=3755 RepID=A0AAD4Z2N4_PRUDU|nr:hypothetical protein L3X38_029978 [Prunus dulcis]